MKSLCVEGWRFIPHSFALINQWQLLAFLNKKTITLGVRDAPYYSSHWRPAKGLFSVEQEIRLASIPTLDLDAPSDATLRISAPFDVSIRSHGRTVVFGTSEY